jgi:Ca2+-binding EF-hand superfamily protein
VSTCDVVGPVDRGGLTYEECKAIDRHLQARKHRSNFASAAEDASLASAHLPEGAPGIIDLLVSTEARKVFSQQCYIPFADMEDASVPLVPNSKSVGGKTSLAPTVPKSTASRKGSLRGSIRYTITEANSEKQAIAREPRETQRLSGDLKVLADATAELPKGEGSGPRKTKSLLLSTYDDDDEDGGSIEEDTKQANIRRVSLESRRSKRHSTRGSLASNWDRPWRTPPKGYRRPSRMGTFNEHHSKRRSFESRYSVETVATSYTSVGSRKHSVETNHTHHSRKQSVETHYSGANSLRYSDTHSDTSDQDHTSRQSSKGRAGSKQATTSKNLLQVSSELKIPLDVVKTAYQIFETHAARRAGYTGASAQPVLERVLTRDAFVQVLMAISGSEKPQDLPKELIYSTFAEADRDNSDDIEFSEFATWYYKHGFSEELLLTPEQREIRDVARRFDIADTSEIERMKGVFDEFDLDRSGTVDFEEFEKLLHKLLKVPAHLELPTARVKQFWCETDLDDSGSINFEEFLVFYAKVFNKADGEGSSPLDTFYRGIRPNPVKSKYESNATKEPLSGPSSPRTSVAGVSFAAGAAKRRASMKQPEGVHHSVSEPFSARRISTAVFKM